MPAFRNVRRSRRISKQPPRDPNTDEWDVHDMELMYQSSDSEESDPASSSSAPTPDASSALTDDSGEPEVDPQSPRPSFQPYPASKPARSSHSRKKLPNHVPRPPNSFMIFRSHLWTQEKIKSTVERDHRQISRIAGKLWRALTDAERAPYHALAEQAKREHAQKYPNYKYSPVYRKDKAPKRKPKPEDVEKELRSHHIASLMHRGFMGDDLTKELEKQEVEDDGEYVESPRRKKTKPRKSPAKKPSSTQRSRRSRDVPMTVKDEVLPEEGVSSPESPDVPMLDALVMTSPIVDSPILADPNSPVLDVLDRKERVTPPVPIAEPDLFYSGDFDEGDFVPQDAIPDFHLGSPAIRFTNPFADASSSPRSDDTAFMSCDPLTPVTAPAAVYCSPSNDFLGLGLDEPIGGPSIGTYDIALFDVKGDPMRPAVDGLKPDYSTMSSPEYPHSLVYDLSIDQPVDQPFFSDWLNV